MLAWTETKGHNPNPAKIKLKFEALSAAKTMPKPEPEIIDIKILDRLPPPSDEGAAAALKRLRGLELIFYARLQKALQGNQLEHITLASAEYGKVCESMRRYEAAVEESRRDLGRLLPKGEAQDGSRAAALWFRISWRLWLSSAILDLLPLSDQPHVFKQKAEETFSEILRVSLNN